MQVHSSKPLVIKTKRVGACAHVCVMKLSDRASAHTPRCLHPPTPQAEAAVFPRAAAPAPAAARGVAAPAKQLPRLAKTNKLMKFSSSKFVSSL
jgi:hypothetical protein